MVGWQTYSCYWLYSLLVKGSKVIWMLVQQETSCVAWVQLPAPWCMCVLDGGRALPVTSCIKLYTSRVSSENQLWFVVTFEWHWMRPVLSNARFGWHVSSGHGGDKQRWFYVSVHNEKCYVLSFKMCTQYFHWFFFPPLPNIITKVVIISGNQGRVNPFKVRILWFFFKRVLKQIWQELGRGGGEKGRETNLSF